MKSKNSKTNEIVLYPFLGSYHIPNVSLYPSKSAARWHLALCSVDNEREVYGRLNAICHIRPKLPICRFWILFD